MTHGHWKRIEYIPGLAVQVLEHVAQGGKQGQQRISERVQTAREPALIQLVLPPMLLHVVF